MQQVWYDTPGKMIRSRLNVNSERRYVLMGLAAKKQTRKLSYSDYLSWNDDERWEIINGEAYNMTPTPATMHQLISTDLLIQLGTQLKGKTCKVFHAPFDVRLPVGDEKEEDIENIVQPDISVICDPRQLDKKGCLGPPDLIIEIISPSTSRIDRMEKFFLYEQVGVKEYWLVSPDDKMVEIFILGTDGKYSRPEIYNETHTIQLKIKALKDIKIDLNSVFSTKIE
jgi:Uma2 family endonuclease